MIIKTVQRNRTYLIKFYCTCINPRTFEDQFDQIDSGSGSELFLEIVDSQHESGKLSLALHRKICATVPHYRVALSLLSRADHFRLGYLPQTVFAQEKVKFF